jgi:hypothetical protein
MPKVTKKDTEGPLAEVPMEMERGEEEALPQKPNFAALSAEDQQGKKIEFRRVGVRWGAGACGD